MKKNPLLFAAAILFVSISFSCKKNSNSTPTYTNYSQLAVGNYWIYADYNIDTNGNATSAGTFDSCYVDRDSVIDGKIYYRMNRPITTGTPNNYNATWLRDSSGSTINSAGTIVFSPTDSRDTFEIYYYVNNIQDTLYSTITQMAIHDTIITVPAGTFTTVASKTTDHIYNISPALTTRVMYTRYAPNVGIVLEDANFYLAVPTSPQRRLVRYHLHN